MNPRKYTNIEMDWVVEYTSSVPKKIIQCSFLDDSNKFRFNKIYKRKVLIFMIVNKYH